MDELHADEEDACEQVAAAYPMSNRCGHVDFGGGSSQLDRILDPENGGVSLQGLANAAKAVGRELHVELK